MNCSHMFRRALVSTMVLTLIACGNQTTQTRTAEATHSGWVQALRQNDRQAALALLADTNTAAPNLDRVLGDIQGLVQHGYTARGGTAAPLQSVDVLPPEDAGKGKVGYSVWTFGTVRLCYATTLAQGEHGWQVTNWGKRNDSECPPLRK